MIKILIADDHFEIRELLKETLNNGNFEVLFTESGTKAVKIANKIHPEIIIMDIMMPGRINGLEAARIIKSTSECINTKIIILSAKGMDQDKINAIKAGASAFINKPFSPVKLLTKIENLLSSPVY